MQTWGAGVFIEFKCYFVEGIVRPWLTTWLLLMSFSMW
jgi:hypothetical protein